MDNQKIKVVVLAAGKGTRLKPYSLDRPKCMVEIEGRSLIDRQLSVLKHPMIGDIVIIGGYKSNMLEGKGDRLRRNPRYDETNMVWSLFSAEDELEGDVIVSYGDIVYSRNVLQSLLDSKADIAVVVDKDWEKYWAARNENPLDDAETLKLREDGTIVELGQKPTSIGEVEGQYIGLMKFSPMGINQIRHVFHQGLIAGELLGRPIENAYLTDLLQASICLGIEIASVPIWGEWIEIDTVNDLRSSYTLDRLASLEADLSKAL